MTLEYVLHVMMDITFNQAHVHSVQRVVQHVLQQDAKLAIQDTKDLEICV